MEFFRENLILIILLPLWLSILAFIGKFFSLDLSKKFLTTATIISSILGIIFSTILCLQFSDNSTYELLIPFISINNFKINLGIYIDKFAIQLILLLYVISLVIQLYSISYMKDTSGHNRFFALLNLFTFAMAGFLLSPNLYQFYIFWELIGICSYLLIGFNYNDSKVNSASKKVFIINRFGDFCLLSGIIISSYFMYIHTNNLNLVQLPFEEINLIATYLYGYTAQTWMNVISVLFILSALCKSAQFPFSSWLIHAMQAPYPVSALIHSATMVTAGIYLVLKLMPVFQWTPEVLTTTIYFVLGSAIINSLCSISQIKAKKILAYSTSAQLGIMLFITLLGYYQLAIIYLIIHAIVKSMLFLICGIIAKLNNEKNSIFELPRMIKFTPLCFGSFLLATISMSGIAFAGYQEKHNLLSIISTIPLYKYAYILIGILTTIYISRMFFVIFIQGATKKELSKPDLLLNTSIIILSVLLLGMSAFLAYPVPNFGILIPIFALLITGFIYYKKRTLYLIPFLNNLLINGFYADKILYYIGAKPYLVINYICTYLEKNINLANKLLVKLFYNIVKFVEIIERYVLDQTIILPVKFTKYSSNLYSKFQNGNTQSYLNYGILILTILLIGLLFIYKFLYTHFNGGIE